MFLNRLKLRKQFGNRGERRGRTCIKGHWLQSKWRRCDYAKCTENFWLQRHTWTELHEHLHTILSSSSTPCKDYTIKISPLKTECCFTLTEKSCCAASAPSTWASASFWTKHLPAQGSAHRSALFSLCCSLGLTLTYKYGKGGCSSACCPSPFFILASTAPAAERTHDGVALPPFFFFLAPTTSTNPIPASSQPNRAQVLALCPDLYLLGSVTLCWKIHPTLRACKCLPSFLQTGLCNCHKALVIK